MIKLNNKGYLIIEIILASLLAMTIAYFLLNLTLKLSNTNQDLYVETLLLTDKATMTNIVMKDIEKYTLKKVEENNNAVILTFLDNNSELKKKIEIDSNSRTFKYGALTESGSYDENMLYEKKLNKNVIISDSDIVISNEKIMDTSLNDSILTIKIPMKTKYSDTDYGLKFVIPNKLNGINVSLTLVTEIKNLALNSHDISEIPNTGDSFENGDFIVVHQPETDQTTQTYDYRYKGASPANYIWFNCDEADGAGNLYGTYSYNYNESTCEKWRIIGVIETEKSDGNKEYLPKIIRDESIGSYSWDNKKNNIEFGGTNGYGLNNWTDAHLMKTLNPGYETFDIDSDGLYEANSLYWNRQSGTCLSGYNESSPNKEDLCDFTGNGVKQKNRNYIEEVKWYLGESTQTITTTLRYYKEQRGKTGGRSSPNTINWTGKVGLMYVDDYGYAAGKKCSSEIALYNYNISCKDSNWLYDSKYNQWTLSLLSGSAYNVILIDKTGYANHYMAGYPQYIKPVVYLKSNTIKIGGTGTNNDPYKIF